MIFLTFFLIPIIVALVSFLITDGKITLKEFGLQMIAQLVLVGGLIIVFSFHNLLDVEIWNGKIVNKNSERVSCEHSYDCNCRTESYSCGTSDNPRTCTRRVCDTCYEHSYDIDWYAKDSTGKIFVIKRDDRRGLTEPRRWAAIQIGEPTSSTRTYNNYIKGNPDSLFRKTGLVEQFKDLLPKYPSTVYDYYKLDRLVTVDVDLQDKSMWNKSLSELNADLGNIKQVNASIVVIKNQPREFFLALEQHWLGGKKNDAITVIGVNNSLQIQWVEIMALGNEEFKVHLRNAVYNVGNLEREKIVAEIRFAVQNYFTRKPMKDFEYLTATTQPTTGQWIFGMLFGLIISIGLSYFFFRNEH